MPAFPRTSVHPVSLRALLREIRAHGERVVAWGSVEETPDAATLTLRLGLNAAPILGPVLAEMLARRKRFIAVLTDERLVLLEGSAARGALPARAVTDQPVAALRTRRTGPWELTVESADLPRAMRLEVVRTNGRSARRLLDALALLAETDPPGTGDDAS